jgi:hypothetical protein
MVLMLSATIDSYIVAVSFIGGGNGRNSPICRKSVMNFIT